MTSLHIQYYTLSFFLVDCVNAKNNVCKNWSDYWFGNKDENENCMYNPDVSLDVPELLEKYYGEYDVHEIPTTDGYFVTTFRIPRNNSRGTILLIHPAFSDCIVWIGSGKESVAYYYWKNGYEIWLPNRRGTNFSKKHVNLTINDYAFWNFSFHETAINDMRASLKYVYKINNNTKPAVMAHSMSSTEMLIYPSLFPEEAEKLSRIFILFEPTSSFKYSRLRFSAVIGPFLEKYSELKQVGDIGGSDSLLARTIHYICSRKPNICNTILSFLALGFSREKEDPLLFPVIFTQVPRAMSIKSVLHVIQLCLSGKFSMYDYGNKNYQIYGSCTPPEYPVSEIIAPIYLVHSTEDKLASSKDTEILYQKLSKSAKIYGKLKVDGFNHVGLFVGLHRNELMYDKILVLLNEKIFSKYSGISFKNNEMISLQEFQG